MWTHREKEEALAAADTEMKSALGDANKKHQQEVMQLDAETTCSFRGGEAAPRC